MDAIEKWAVMSEEIAWTAEQAAAIRKVVLDAAPVTLAEFDAATSDEARFYALPRATFAAYHLERFTLAKAHAQLALTLAENFKDNWNFGNAVHSAHSILGLLALDAGDRSSALTALQAAGATPGSPQLNSFGPTMQLAIALLELGEREAVLNYLDQCAVFWRLGNSKLAIWRRKIAAGSMPNFFSHRFG